MFVLSGVCGFAYDFELYLGKQDNVLMDREPDCGASGNVVIRLSRSLQNVNYKLYFDNYFNSPDLQIALAGRGF
jgi:Transposase IS4